MADPPPATVPPLELMVPLRALAEPHGLKLGSAVDVRALAGEDYRHILGNEFNAVTAENAMKWNEVEPTQGVYDRAPANQLIAFAEQHDQQIYGHTLVWHKQVPAWVTDEGHSVDELRNLLRTRVEGEAAYFQGRVWAWDVVNEPLHTDGTLRNSFWLQRLGPEYLADAFRWARAGDPDAKLFLNDFGIEGINAKSNALYDLVAGLLAQGVPIDGVGFQVHWTLDPLPSSFEDNLRRFAALGLDVAITEMDVRMGHPYTAEKLGQQATVYADALRTCLAVERCVSFTVWGFTDAYSWVPAGHPGNGAATIFDKNLSPKPAYLTIAEVLEQS